MQIGCWVQTIFVGKQSVQFLTTSPLTEAVLHHKVLKTLRKLQRKFYRTGILLCNSSKSCMILKFSQNNTKRLNGVLTYEIGLTISSGYNKVQYGIEVLYLKNEQVMFIIIVRWNQSGDSFIYKTPKARSQDPIVGSVCFGFDFRFLVQTVR